MDTTKKLTNYTLKFLLKFIDSIIIGHESKLCQNTIISKK